MQGNERCCISTSSPNAARTVRPCRWGVCALPHPQKPSNFFCAVPESNTTAPCRPRYPHREPGSDPVAADRQQRDAADHRACRVASASWRQHRGRASLAPVRRCRYRARWLAAIPAMGRWESRTSLGRRERGAACARIAPAVPGRWPRVRISGAVTSSWTTWSPPESPLWHAPTAS